MKVALCAIVKCENNYLIEWINYHLNLSIDHIFIYDNNDLDGEKVSDIIDDKNITIIDYRGKKYVQNWAYTNCYKTYYKEYDWFIFIDLDEFVVLENECNIKNFLEYKYFSDIDIIRLNWKHFSDNNFLGVHDNNYNVFNRFITPIQHKKDVFGKSIIRSTIKLEDIKLPTIINAHGFNNENYKAVDSMGNKCLNYNCIVSKIPLYKNAWINHYPTKTIEEYIKFKYFRGDATSMHLDKKYSNLEHFFEYNIYTKEKENYALELIQKYKKSNNIK